MENWYPFFGLIGMLFSGALGSLGSRFLAAREASTGLSTPSETPKNMWDVIFTGAAAAMMVPLFLVLASPGSINSLLTDVFDYSISKNNSYTSRLLILCSYCVVFGMFFRKFAAKMSSVLEKRLVDAELSIANNSNKLNDLKQDVVESVSDVTEKQEKNLTPDVKKDRIIQKLSDSESRHWRAAWSIAAQTKLSTHETDEILKTLVKEQKVETITRASGEAGYRILK